MHFAHQHFANAEINLDRNSQQICPTEERLKRRQLAVVETANTTPAALRKWVGRARKYHAFAIAIVFSRGDKAEFWRDRNLANEGFKDVLFIETFEKRIKSKLSRTPLWPDKRDLTGPFDIIGDVHSCADELAELLGRLGCEISWYEGAPRTCFIVPPAGRTIVFVGDLVGAGTKENDVHCMVRALVESGSALCVWGDNDDRRRDAMLRNDCADPGYRNYVQEFNESYSFSQDHSKSLAGDVAVSHLWLDGGSLVVTHAAIRADMIGRSSNAVRRFCIYGGDRKKPAPAVPIDQLAWVQDYRGHAAVVYGHTSCARPEWRNNTIGINTGCASGGALTALRWPELEIVSVQALGDYSAEISSD